MRTFSARLDAKTEMISLRVPENLLRAFRYQAQADGRKYQSTIVQLMREWLTTRSSSGFLNRERGR